MLVLVNGEARQLDPGITVWELVRSLSRSPEGQGVAVALDGEVVPRRAWPDTRLREGSRVEIVAAVQGG
jgi:sulfur carrier protein